MHLAWTDGVTVRVRARARPRFRDGHAQAEIERELAARRALIEAHRRRAEAVAAREKAILDEAVRASDERASGRLRDGVGVTPWKAVPTPIQTPAVRTDRGSLFRRPFRPFQPIGLFRRPFRPFQPIDSPLCLSFVDRCRDDVR